MDLTKREIQVLDLFLAECPLKEMAHRLSISEKTASMHKQNAMQKLGVDNDVALVKLALRTGLADRLQVWSALFPPARRRCAAALG